MTIVAEKYDYVIGIDTHARTHTYAIIDTRTGGRTGCEAFPVSGPGLGRAIAWIRRNTTNEVIAAVEGSRSYGTSICRELTDAGITVAEVKPPRRQARARSDGLEQRIARQEATELANDILSAAARLKSNKTQLAELSEQIAPGFQDQPGLGPVTTGIILVSYSHPGRFRSEAAFASLAGAAPLQASSGNVTRHRLNRHGDRQLNMALDVVIRNRMIHDQTTKEYAERRTAEGLSYREIKRVLKRYLARSIFRWLERNFALT